MQWDRKHFFAQRIRTFVWIGFLVTTAYAGTPLWTFEPLTATSIVLHANDTAMVQYQVTNRPTTQIAFFFLGGLVFEESAGSGKILIDDSKVFNSQWTSANSDIVNATNADDGVANTDAIIADTACSDELNNCAAQRCRDIIGANWYLPAINELFSARISLCSNLEVPCNFGGLSSDIYWSSTQESPAYAFDVDIPSVSRNDLLTK